MLTCGIAQPSKTGYLEFHSERKIEEDFRMSV